MTSLPVLSGLLFLLADALCDNRCDGCTCAVQRQRLHCCVAPLTLGARRCAAAFTRLYASSRLLMLPTSRLLLYPIGIQRIRSSNSPSVPPQSATAPSAAAVGCVRCAADARPMRPSLFSRSVCIPYSPSKHNSEGRRHCCLLPTSPAGQYLLCPSSATFFFSRLSLLINKRSVNFKFKSCTDCTFSLSFSFDV
jgi:hypothetical protein